MAWGLRDGTEADLGSVLALWREAESLPTPTDSEPALLTLFARDPRALLLATDGEQVIGSLIAGWDGWRGSFYRLAVHPQRRRQGIATALVRAGEQRLAAIGAARLTAVAATDEHDAVALWKAVGYEQQAGRARFVRTLAAPR